MNKKTILIGGGTGLVGQRIISLLDPTKYNIKILSRNPIPDDKNTYVKWDISKMSIDDHAMDNVDYIINLTGAGIADHRWSDSRKKTIIDSRVNSTQLLQQTIMKSGIRPKAFISASAIGYYGDRSDEELTETSHAGDDFLAHTCVLWEKATLDLAHLVDREVRIRIGLVLSMDGGALPQLLITSKIGVFNYFGDGNQYYSWIHIDDLARIFIYVIENESTEGIYNGVSPHPITFKSFVKSTKKGLDAKGVVFPIPAFIIKLILGEMSSVVLNSTRVTPERLVSDSFSFKFPDLRNAISMLKKNQK